MSLPVLRIETVETPAQLREFVRFPLRIYSTDSPWVPPIWKEEMKRLDSARGDFFQHSDAQLYLARDADGEPVVVGGGSCSTIAGDETAEREKTRLAGRPVES